MDIAVADDRELKAVLDARTRWTGPSTGVSEPAAQVAGRRRWYRGYTVQVAKIVREYGHDGGEADPGPPSGEIE